jgi:MFS family permease
MTTLAESRPNTAPSRSLGPFARIFLASLCSHLAAFLFIHLPDFMVKRHASETMIGAAFSVCSLFAVLARPAVGYVMDTRGRRPALIAGGIMHVATAALFLTVETPGTWLLVVRALQGIAFGTFFSAVFAVASDLAPPEARTQRLAVFGISGILPMSLGALLGDAILRYDPSYQSLFLTATGLAAVGLGFAASVPETAEPSATAGPGDPWAALRPVSLRWLWVSGILFAIAIAAYFAFVKNFVVAQHIGVTAFFTPYAITAILVRVLFGFVPGRFGEANVFPPALLMLGAGLVALAGAHAPITVGLAGALCGLGHAFAFPTLMSLFVERSAPEIRGSVVAMFTALMDIGFFLAGPLFGHVADVHGHRVVFVLAAGVAVASFALFMARARKPAATYERDVEAATGVD